MFSIIIKKTKNKNKINFLLWENNFRLFFSINILKDHCEKINTQNNSDNERPYFHLMHL
jgi:hypothetical protein